MASKAALPMVQAFSKQHQLLVLLLSGTKLLPADCQHVKMRVTLESTQDAANKAAQSSRFLPTVLVTFHADSGAAVLNHKQHPYAPKPQVSPPVLCWLAICEGRVFV
jgi:hypothetical protein